MKKTLVALSILAAATSVQAIELYNQDGVTVDVSGDIEVTYQNSFTKSSMSQQIEDADIAFDARYAINEDLSFGAFIGYDGSDSNNGSNVDTGDVYAALYSKTYGSIKFGDLCTAADDLGSVTSDQQFDINKLATGSANDYTCNDQEGIRYDFDNGTFYTTVGFVQNKENEHNKAADKNGRAQADYIDGRFGYRVADLDMSLFLANTAFDGAKEDEFAYAVEVNYSGIQNVRLGTGYYANSSDDVKVESDSFVLGADYYMGKVWFGAGYSLTSFEETGAEDQNRWFVNANYNLATNTTLYVEVAGSDATSLVERDGVKVLRDDTTAMAIGIEASF